MTTSPTSLPPLSALTLLVGHTSAETAFVQPDYPYGRTLRCKRRVWVEYKQGHGMRFCAQTTDPKRSAEVWNKPKCDTYQDFTCLLLDQSNGYVHPYSLSVYSTKESFQQFWGLYYRKLDAFNQEHLDGLGMTLSRHANARYSVDPVPLRTDPRIEMQMDWFYDRDLGLSYYIYAHQVGEGNPDDLPVVSALRLKNGQFYPHLRPQEIMPEMQAQARTIVKWGVTDYPKPHWCYAVLRGYRGFEWEGQPINHRVAELIVLSDRGDLSSREKRKKLWQELWAIAEAYWEQQVELQQVKAQSGVDVGGAA